MDGRNPLSKTLLLAYRLGWLTLILIGCVAVAACASKSDLSMMEDDPSSVTVSAAPSPTAGAALPPGFVFMIGNDDEVFNGGTPPTFRTDRPYAVKELWTYHWNGGKGAPEGGTLSLRSSDGKTYGPWNVEVTNAVYWVAKLDFTLPAGDYTVVDSDPDTLAQNKQSDGLGHAWMKGEPA